MEDLRACSFSQLCDEPFHRTGTHGYRWHGSNTEGSKHKAQDRTSTLSVQV